MHFVFALPHPVRRSGHAQEKSGAVAGTFGQALSFCPTFEPGTSPWKGEILPLDHDRPEGLRDNQRLKLFRCHLPGVLT